MILFIFFCLLFIGSVVIFILGINETIDIYDEFLLLLIFFAFLIGFCGIFAWGDYYFNWELKKHIENSFNSFIRFITK